MVHFVPRVPNFFMQFHSIIFTSSPFSANHDFDFHRRNAVVFVHHCGCCSSLLPLSSPLSSLFFTCLSLSWFLYPICNFFLIPLSSIQIYTYILKLLQIENKLSNLYTQLFIVVIVVHHCGRCSIFIVIVSFIIVNVVHRRCHFIAILGYRNYKLMEIETKKWTKTTTMDNNHSDGQRRRRCKDESLSRDLQKKDLK